MSDLRLVSVTPLPGQSRLELVWQDQRMDIVDIAPLIDEYEVFAPLEQPDVFSRVALGEDGWFVEWPEVENAAIAVDTLWRLAREASGDIMPRDEFRAWRRRNGLSLSAAANALGFSRRLVAYYDSGEKLIPKHVALACIGYEFQRHGRGDPGRQPDGARA